MSNALDKFELNRAVVIITGGAGVMGMQHAEAVIEAGGLPVIWDINKEQGLLTQKKLKDKYPVPVFFFEVDITDKEQIKMAMEKTLEFTGSVDILINNAAVNPHVNKDRFSGNRFEDYDLDAWNKDIEVGLTGTFLCSQVIGSYMAEKDGGVILNIASDLGVIAPDQRIYQKEGLDDKDQPKKPVSYSVVKHGVIGLTKYMATYWADDNIRVNSISPGGIYVGQDEKFVKKLSNLIPMARMANADEYKAAVVFLISNASSYMTGSNLVIDGGRTTW